MTAPTNNDDLKTDPRKITGMNLAPEINGDEFFEIVKNIDPKNDVWENFKLPLSGLSPLVIPGKDGKDGKSAYQIAIMMGFKGTMAEWLMSLKGDKGTRGNDGTDGVDGMSAYEIAVANGFVGTEEEWLSSLGGVSTTGTAMLSEKNITNVTNTVHARNVYFKAKLTNDITKGSPVKVVEVLLDGEVIVDESGFGEPIVGIAEDNFLANELGKFIVLGEINGLDISTFNEGDPIYWFDQTTPDFGGPVLERFMTNAPDRRSPHHLIGVILNKGTWLRTEVDGNGDVTQIYDTTTSKVLVTIHQDKSIPSNSISYGGIIDADNVHTALEVLQEQKLSIIDLTGELILQLLAPVDGDGSGLDADMVGGIKSKDISQVGHTHLTKDVTDLQVQWLVQMHQSI